MLRRRWWWMLLCGLLPCLVSLAGEGTRPDPLPLRRVYIAPERVPLELERVQKGALVLLPRAEFEAKVQQAALAVELAASPPRLTKARYAAQLVGQALTGTADWSVLHAAPGPGLLALSDLNLAVTSQVTVAGEAGIIGDFDGKSPSLWIAKPGPTSVGFKWSRRGTPSNEGLHFDLQVPACASAQLELKLPTEYQLIVNQAGLQLATEQSGDGPLRKWVISFAGKSRIEFDVRRQETGHALVMASVLTRQELGPDRVLSDFEFQVEALHGSVSQLIFDGDASLQPFEVTVGGVQVKDWEWQPAQPGKAPENQGVLILPLAEPVQGLLPPVCIHCLAQVSSKNRVWVSPGLQLQGALSRGELLQVKIPAEAQLENWNAADFRLTKSNRDADGSKILALVHSGQGQPRPSEPLLSASFWHLFAALEGYWRTSKHQQGRDGMPPPSPIQRPTAVVKTSTTEFLLEQQAWWQLDLEGSTLIAELTCKPSRGQLYHLPLKLPANSQVDQPLVEPKEMLRGWAAGGSGQAPLLLIDFAKAVTPQTAVRIKLKLRLPPRTVSKKGDVLAPLPDIEPQVAPRTCLREGSLAVSLHPRWRAEVVKTSWPATAPPDGPGLWQSGYPDYYFAFRGTPLTGQLRLLPRAPQFQAKCQSDVFVGRGLGTLVARVTIEPTGGSLDYIDLLTSAPLAEPWKVRGESTGPRVVSVKRLAGLDALPGLMALGASQALEVLPTFAVRPLWQSWRLRFAEPVRNRVTLVLEAPLESIPLMGGSSTKGERHWEVPVVRVVDADQFAGELAVQAVGAEITLTEVNQMEEFQRPVGKPGTPRGQHMWRIYHYDNPSAASQTPSLRIKTRLAAMELVAHEICDRASLTSRVESAGRLVHHFRFRLVHWRPREVPVLLPPGAKLLSARTQGRWLTSLSQREGADGVQVLLPADATVAVQNFDICYTTPHELSPWAVWETWTAPVPHLPLRPLDIRQQWLLPSDFMPFDSAWLNAAGSFASEKSPEFALMAENAWHAGHSLLAGLAPQGKEPSWAMTHKQHLEAVEAALRRQFGPQSNWVLGPVVDTLAFGKLSHDVPWVVDIAALAGAGLTPASKFADGSSKNADPWGCLQLTVVATPGGLLLTTRQQSQQWNSSGESAWVESGPMVDAVVQAAQRGHDSTGRFCSAVFWLQAQSDPGTHYTDRDALADAGSSSAWTPWEATPLVVLPSKMVAVRPMLVNALGLLLGGVLAVTWVTVGGMSRSGRMLVVWFTGAILAALWLPASLRNLAAIPTAIALVVACVGVLWRRFNNVQHLNNREGLTPSKSATAAAIVAIAFALGLASLGLPAVYSQGADVTTVLVLAGPPEMPDRQDVLVTPDLLKSLDKLIQRGPQHVRHAVLTAAGYDGALAGDVAQLTAKYQIYCFGDDASLTVPLAGVELREGAMLDGKPVQLTSAPTAGASEVGYVVPVKGKGHHSLTVPFNVRLKATADHLELRFAVPRLLQSRLLLRTPSLPGAAPAGKDEWGAEAQVLSGTGAIKTTTLDGKHQELAVDVGRDSIVHVRWPAAHVGPAAKVSVREAYYWDLRSPNSTCTALLNYTVTAGATSRFSVALPDSLEPRLVEVAGAEIEGKEETKPRIKQWRFVETDGQARLQVDLQAPVAGNVVLTLHLVPRLAPPPISSATNMGPKLDVNLTLPLPLDATSEGGIIGYRVEGFEATDKAANMKASLLSPEQFNQQWSVKGVPGQMMPTRAINFKERQPQAALVVTLTAPKCEFDQVLTWTLRPGRADLVATLTAKTKAEDLLLIEWDVPPQVTVAEITGENIRSWSRPSGATRIQVWLEQPAKNVSLSLRGWMTYMKVPANQLQRWIMPWLRAPQATSGRTEVLYAEDGGVRIQPDFKKFVNLTAVQPPTTSTWVCQDIIETYRAEFVVRPAPMPARVLAVTIIEPRERSLLLSGQWQVHVPQGGQTSFKIAVANWSGLPLKLEGPADVRISPLRAPEGQQQWQVNVAAGAPRRFQLKVTGTRPAVGGGVVTLPAFHLDNAVWGNHWVAARTPGLDVQSAVGLAPVKDVSAELGLPQGAAERIGQGARLWKALAPDWKLSLLTRRSTAVPGLHVLLAEQQLAFGESFGWIHQTSFLLRNKDASELMIDMPAGALLLATSVNGNQISPRFVGPDRLGVELPPSQGLHHLVLRYSVGQQTDHFEQPQLMAPKVDGAPGLVFNWTLILPQGFRLDRAVAALDQLPGTARHEFARAEAQDGAVQALAEEFQRSGDDTLKAKMATYQQLFAWHLRLAKNAVQVHADETTAYDLKQRLAELERQNAARAKSIGLDKPRPQGDKSASVAAEELDSMPGRGTIVRWQGSAEAEPSQAVLVSFSTDARSRAWVATAGVALAVFIILWLSFAPHFRGRLRQFWPEQIAGLALVGCALWGFSPVAAVLLLVALSGRMTYAVSRFLRWRKQAVGGTP